MNGKQYGFQKQLDTVKDWRTVPGWFSTEKGDFIRKRINTTFDRIGYAPGGWFEILDLGSWKGKSGTAMATALQVGRVYTWCVDHWFGSPGERETNHVQAGIRPLSVLWEFLQYTSHLGVLGNKLGYISTPSRVATDYFEDQQFSYMFIDGDHQGAYDDLKRWLPKLRIGGELVGDDLNWPLVRTDVDAWMEKFGDKYGIEYEEHNVNGPVYRMVRTR